jgi:hypothetical protein
MVFKEVGCEDVNWIQLAQDNVQWQALVNPAINLLRCKFETSSKSAILHWADRHDVLVPVHLAHYVRIRYKIILGHQKNFIGLVNHYIKN